MDRLIVHHLFMHGQIATDHERAMAELDRELEEEGDADLR